MEKTINKKLIYDGKIVKLVIKDVLLPNNNTSKREIIYHQPGVSIVANNEKYVYLVKQYRSAVEKDVIEIPAGLVEKDEDPMVAAIRELQEEIGFSARKIELLVKFYPSPGFCDEVTYIYHATDLFESKLPEDEDEFINVIKLPLSEIESFIKNTDIIDAKTALGLTMLLNKKTKSTD